MKPKRICNKCGLVVEKWTDEPHLRKGIDPTQENLENPYSLCYGKFEQLRSRDRRKAGPFLLWITVMRTFGIVPLGTQRV